MNTYIYLTTQTSATDSMLRIFCALLGKDFVDAKYIDNFLSAHPIAELKNAELPLDGHLHRYNLPPYFDVNKIKSQHKLVINYRDPRDHFCNVYHWQFNHPVRGESETEKERRLEILAETTIDQFVLEKANTKYYESIIKSLTSLNKDDFVVLSYARLCLDFDSFLSKAAGFFNVELNDTKRNALEVERVENLSSNKQYIGNKWGGADVGPGRYKDELKVETIEELNKRFKYILQIMAEYDDDFARFYL